MKKQHSALGTRHLATLGSASLVALVTMGALAQQAAAPKPGTQITFTANSRLVVENVTVTDKNGQPVTGLTAKDFVVTEEGAPQTVAIFEFQKLDDNAVAAAAANIPAPPPASAARPAPGPVTAIEITPETPGVTHYNDRRLVVLYFDMTAMPVSDQLRSLDSAQRFVATQMKPADLMAVMEYEGSGVRVKQNFTADKDLLQQTIGKMIVGTGLGMDESTSDADTADTGSAFGQDDSEFNIFNTNRQLAALQTAINMLAPLSEKKSLVYFASGLNLNGVDNQAQLEATTNAAIRANVQLYPLDARGLVAGAPLGDATQGSPGGVAMYNGGAASAFNLRLQNSQDTLYALGSDTGGKAILDTNNLSQGIATARNAINSYYIIGYYTSNAALDGKYRHVKVSLAPERAGIKLAYRTGYYAGKVFAKFTEADKERQLEDALMLGDPITDLTIQLEVNYFQLNSAEYFVPIAAKIPGSELALAKKGGAEQSLIDFIGEVKDEYGTTVSNLRDKVVLKLSGEKAEQLSKSPIEYTTGFTVLPGKYTIKLLARDSETGRIGTYMRDFTVPNLVKMTDRLPISTVVLSSQKSPLSTALYNANKDTARDPAQANNPLVENGSELMPSVTRVFSRQAPMYVYLQAYEHGVTAMQPLEAYVTFYPVPAPPAAAPNGASGAVAAQTAGGATPAPATTVPAKFFETPPENVNTGLHGRADAVPIAFSVPLDKLAPGKYTCQVTVLDPATQRANFWRGEIEIRP